MHMKYKIYKKKTLNKSINIFHVIPEEQ